MVSVNQFEPDYIVPPAESIREMLEAYGMTQKELAARMDLTEKTMTKIMKGQSPITKEHAKSLENILELPASYWLNLQRNYDDKKFELEYKENLKKQEILAKKFPQQTLKNMGLLPKGKLATDELVSKLLKIFKVNHLNKVLQLYYEPYNCRIAHQYQIDPYALAMWIRLGEVKIEETISYDEVPSFNRQRVFDHIDDLRSLNIEINPKIFIPKLQQMCEKLGILFIVVPEIKGSRITGMARWKKVGRRNIPTIQLSLRGKRHDGFWFTFFHELGHLVLHAKNTDIYIDHDVKSDHRDIKEEEANKFARNILIPEDDYKEFIENKIINYQTIQKFSGKIGIHPGIVVGRLQKDNIIKYSHFNKLKQRYKWSFEVK